MKFVMKSIDNNNKKKQMLVFSIFILFPQAHLKLGLLSTVDSVYLQVVFVRENIAIKQSARLPESSIQTGSLTELQM